MSQTDSESTLRIDMMKRKQRIMAIVDPKERNLEIAFFVVDTLYDMRKQLPPIPPKDYLEFKAASPNDQRKAVEGGFWNNEDVQRYIDKKKFAEQQNIDNAHWLRTVIKYLDPDDLDRINKINAKIKEIDSSYLPKEPININWKERQT